MTMTESDAREKWCPFARGFHGDNRAAYGSHGDGPVEDDYSKEMAANYPCITSDCMAWEWDADQQVGDYLPVNAGKLKMRRGYCGRARAPQ